MSDAHDFLAWVEWQKGNGYVPVFHVRSVSAVSGAEYKWDAVWCTFSSPRYLLLWNAAVTSLNNCLRINRKCGRDQRVPINRNTEEKESDLKNLPNQKYLANTRQCCPLGYVFVSFASCVSYSCRPFLPLPMVVCWNHNTEFVTPQLFPWQLVTVIKRGTLRMAAQEWYDQKF